MKRTQQTVWALSALLILAAVALWLATGTRVLSRLPSETIATAQADDDTTSFDDLFADAGLNDDLGELEDIDNAYRFGLVPAGPGLDALSVLSVAGVCAVASLVVWQWGRRRREG